MERSRGFPISGFAKERLRREKSRSTGISDTRGFSKAFHKDLRFLQERFQEGGSGLRNLVFDGLCKLRSDLKSVSRGCQTVRGDITKTNPKAGFFEYYRNLKVCKDLNRIFRDSRAFVLG